MTDTQFYDRMDELAQRLLNKFGTAATFRRLTKGEVGADGKAAVVPTDFPGLAVKTEHQDVLDRLANNPSAAFVFKGPQSPENDSHLIHAAVAWKIVDVKKISPEGTRIIVSFVGCVAAE